MTMLMGLQKPYSIFKVENVAKIDEVFSRYFA